MLTDKEVLLEARKYLARNKKEVETLNGYTGVKLHDCVFICHALNEVVRSRAPNNCFYEADYKERKQNKRIKEIIDQLLDGEMTIEDWLYAGNYIKDTDKASTKIQQYRLRWLNHLASKCNSKGKLTYKNARS